VRTIIVATVAFLFAALVVAPFEAFAQSGGGQNDSTSTPVPSKKNNKKRKKRPRSSKPVPSTTADTSERSSELTQPVAPPPAAEAAPAIASPVPQPTFHAEPQPPPPPPPQSPSMANERPSSTVELAPQREHRGMLMIAPKIGLFKSTTALQAAFYSGVELGVATPLLSQRLAVVFEFNWVRPHYSSSITDPRLPSGGGAFSLRESEFGFLLSAVYRFEDALPGLTPYGGLGPSLYYQRAALTAFDSVNVESESKLGFQLLGGADYRLGPGALFGEVHYHYAKVDFVGTGNVNVGGFLAIGVGYRFRFF
jgi:opacity protein-like surface antigen